MKLKSVLLSLLAAGFVAALCAACATMTPRLSRADAEKIALAKVPGGQIKEAELEKEHGVLVWSFDIATPGSPNITEVLVNANTGEIVKTEIETPADQAKEAKEKKK